ncbi:MAG: hypothetical protein AAF661_11165 [Pseudomonadota bacterium]
MNGIYAMFFTGASGMGNAVFVMKAGVIAGADVVGGILDGSYRTNEQGGYDVAVTMKFPAGTMLVTGATAGQSPMTQEIKTKLPGDFSNGQPLMVDTPTGPVNVAFRRLRDMI